MYSTKILLTAETITPHKYFRSLWKMHYLPLWGILCVLDGKIIPHFKPFQSILDMSQYFFVFQSISISRFLGIILMTFKINSKVSFVEVAQLTEGLSFTKYLKSRPVKLETAYESIFCNQKHWLLFLCA